MKKAIIIAGQTASGKTSFSLEIATKYGGEIISADSMQVYRKMDIGTAKPTKSELSVCPHHLIDIKDICEPFSAGDFVSLGKEALDGISGRGKIPLIVGGTGLYSNMLFSSFSLSENKSEAIKAVLEKRAEVCGADALYAELMNIDEETAKKTEKENIRRVIRYLEIFYTTGNTPTEMNEINNSGEKEYLPLCLCFYASDRSVIYTRIENRVDEMMKSGLLDEVSELYGMGLEKTPTASAAIGYKEFFPYFRNEISLENAINDVKQFSRNYAKRQETYFKKLSKAVMIDITSENYMKTAFEKVKNYLEA